MNIQNLLISKISKLLDNTFTRIILESDEQLHKVNRVSLSTNSGHNVELILKRRNNQSEIIFYNDFLSKYDLNSPKWYGYISIEGENYLVLEYVNYLEPDWQDFDRYNRALDWLIKKDQICINNWDFIKNYNFGELQWYGIAKWVKEIQVAYENKANPSVDKNFWDLISKNYSKLEMILSSLENSKHRTLAHNDLHMGNILFGEKSEDGQKLFVIDWTNPHLTSICRDLAQLVDYVNPEQRLVLINKYKEVFNFQDFDAEFKNAVIIRDLHYLSWMMMELNDGNAEYIYQSEIDRVIERLKVNLN